MFPKKERVLFLLGSVENEIDLLQQMSASISTPDDFVSNLTGMTVFRACGMSLQFITENLVKVRNLCGMDLFKSYNSVPWERAFGMRNFLSHEYGDVDAEGIFNTVKYSIPSLKPVIFDMLSDIRSGKHDQILN